MMFHIISRLTLVALALSFVNGGDVDQAIDNVFGSENRNNDEKVNLFS